MKSTLTIQEKLKDLRIEKGISLEELASKTGISKSAMRATITRISLILRSLHFQSFMECLRIISWV